MDLLVLIMVQGNTEVLVETKNAKLGVDILPHIQSMSVTATESQREYQMKKLHQFCALELQCTSL
jgi:hypothetical protein